MTLYQGEPVTVLVIDDNSLILMGAVACVEFFGCLTKSACNSAEALVLLNGSAAIDVLFTDVDLGGEMDGVALAEEGRRLNPDLGLLITSGSAFPATRTMPMGGIFIPKPYGPEEVSAALRGIIAQAPGLGAAQQFSSSESGQ